MESIVHWIHTVTFSPVGVLLSILMFVLFAIYIVWECNK